MSATSNASSCPTTRPLCQGHRSDSRHLRAGCRCGKTDVVLFSRNGVKPEVDETATVSASVVGNVTIAAGCYVGHGAVIESSGPPVELGAGVLVTANAVVRSTGGRHRPAFPVTIGADTLVAPQSVLIGCSIGADCYVA